MNELQMATINELIDELERRLPMTLVGWISPISEGEQPTGECFHLRFNGGFTVCLGLVERMRMEIKRAILRNDEVCEDDDDCQENNCDNE